MRRRPPTAAFFAPSGGVAQAPVAARALLRILTSHARRLHRIRYDLYQRLRMPQHESSHTPAASSVAPALHASRAGHRGDNSKLSSGASVITSYRVAQAGVEGFGYIIEFHCRLRSGTALASSAFRLRRSIDRCRARLTLRSYASHDEKTTQTQLVCYSRTQVGALGSPPPHRNRSARRRSQRARYAAASRDSQHRQFLLVSIRSTVILILFPEYHHHSEARDLYH
jgi:hypothetical protein